MRLLAAVVLAATGGAAATPPVDVVASNWAFTPAKIVMHVGVPTTLRVTSREGVHGLASDAVGIPKTTLLPGKVTTIVVTPKKAGLYKVPCSIICGAGHASMILTVDVEP